MRTRISLLPFLLLATLLMGGTFGCGKEGGEAGVVSSSESYSFKRSSIGASFETMTSSEGTYQIDATLGHHLSQGRHLSKRFHYLILQPLSQPKIVEEEAAEEGTSQ